MAFVSHGTSSWAPYVVVTTSPVLSTSMVVGSEYIGALFHSVLYGALPTACVSVVVDPAGPSKVFSADFGNNCF